MLKELFSVTVILTVGVAFGLRKNHQNKWKSQFSDLKAVQIVKFIEDKPVLDHTSLRKVFQHEKAIGKPAIIISLAGDQGIGKSFLMNWCLRYLYYIQYNDDKSLPALLKKLLGNNEKLSGFDWGNKVCEGGTTSGILVWPQPFILKLKDNTEVAVFLMDTQGNHDTITNNINNAIVYNLSTLISSIQIYNIVEKPKYFDYKHLVQFSNYGIEATQQQKNSIKPFQKLIFLVRDWSAPSKFSYGVSGGERYKNEMLLALNSQSAEDVKTYKRRIKDLYTNINCFMMPHPGNKIKVEDFREFNLDILSKEFSQELINFMKWIFGTENINPANIKKINGLTIYADDVPHHFNINFKNLLDKGGEYKSIDEWINASTIASNCAALTHAHSHYNEEMEKGLKFIGTWDDGKYQELHAVIYEKSIKKFRETDKLGNKAIHDQFENQLKNSMTELFNKTKELRDVQKARDLLIAAAGITAAVLTGANIPDLLPFLTGIETNLESMVMMESILRFIV